MRKIPKASQVINWTDIGGEHDGTHIFHEWKHNGRSYLAILDNDGIYHFFDHFGNYYDCSLDRDVLKERHLRGEAVACIGRALRLYGRLI